MTKIEKLQVRASELRSEINGLLFQDDALTDEQNTELTEKRAALEDVEKRWRIAVETHPDPTEREKETSGDTLTSDQTEFANLEDGVKLAGFLLGAPSGASLEYRQETGLGDSVPWVGLLDGPERVQLRIDAYSVAPATGTAVNVQAIIDRVTAGLHARRLGVTFPVVARGTAAWQHVTGGVTPESASKGAEIDASAWTLTPKTADPKRVQVRVAWRREDAAMVSMFEDALRREARAALEEALDKMALDSFGTGADIINGLRPSLTAGTSLGGISVGTLLAGMASVIDGKWRWIPSGPGPISSTGLRPSLTAGTSLGGISVGTLLAGMASVIETLRVRSENGPYRTRATDLPGTGRGAHVHRASPTGGGPIGPNRRRGCIRLHFRPYSGPGSRCSRLPDVGWKHGPHRRRCPRMGRWTDGGSRPVFRCEKRRNLQRLVDPDQLRFD